MVTTEKDVITMYSTTWCSDCVRAKRFMDEHGIAYNEINIEQSPQAAQLVMQHNEGKRRVPTLHIDGRYYGNPPIRDLGRLLGVL